MSTVFLPRDNPRYQHDFSDKDYTSYYTDKSITTVVFSGYERITEASLTHFDDFEKLQDVCFIYFNPEKISSHSLAKFFKSHKKIEKLTIFNSFNADGNERIRILSNLIYIPEIKSLSIITNDAENHSYRSKCLIDSLEEVALPNMLEECLLSGKHINYIPKSLHGRVKVLKLHNTGISASQVDNFIKDNPLLETVFYPKAGTQLYNASQSLPKAV